MTGRWVFQEVVYLHQRPPGLVSEPRKKAIETKKVLELRDQVILSVESDNSTLGLTVSGAL